MVRELAGRELYCPWPSHWYGATLNALEMMNSAGDGSKGKQSEETETAGADVAWRETDMIHGVRGQMDRADTAKVLLEQFTIHCEPIDNQLRSAIFRIWKLWSNPGCYFITASRQCGGVPRGREKDRVCLREAVLGTGALGVAHLHRPVYPSPAWPWLLQGYHEVGNFGVDPASAQGPIGTPLAPAKPRAASVQQR
ncbi:hypothetical protein CHU98_g9252 [Xylaria longipes]|nr:hypothetical protein CHU98_g9252 [Xylaria longipes]